MFHSVLTLVVKKRSHGLIISKQMLMTETDTNNTIEEVIVS